MRDWSSIGDAPGLRARGVFVAEGRRVVQCVLDGAAGGADAIVAALATPAAAQALDLHARLGARLEECDAAGMQTVTGYNFHRGVLALVRRPDPVPADRLVAAATTTGDAARQVFVVGERIADADNVGSLFRNARAFGAAAVLLDDGSVDPLYRKAVRTSLGAVLTMPWTSQPFDDIGRALLEAGVAAIGLTPASSAVSLAEAIAATSPGRPIALVVGNEGEGLSASALARCEAPARIPMAPGADSLNVATALAVALYELRQRPAEISGRPGNRGAAPSC